MITKALPTTKQLELIDKWEFAKTVLDESFETFMIYITTLEIFPKPSEIMIHPF